MLQGASGTTVDIQYRPNGSTAPVDLTIEREKIKLPAVPYRSVIGDSTGYVILSAFTWGSSFELRQAIRYPRTAWASTNWSSTCGAMAAACSRVDQHREFIRR